MKKCIRDKKTQIFFFLKKNIIWDKLKNDKRDKKRTWVRKCGVEGDHTWKTWGLKGTGLLGEGLHQREKKNENGRGRGKQKSEILGGPEEGGRTHKTQHTHHTHTHPHTPTHTHTHPHTHTDVVFFVPHVCFLSLLSFFILSECRFFFVPHVCFLSLLSFFILSECLLFLSRSRFVPCVFACFVPFPFFCPTTAVQVFRAYGLGVQGVRCLGCV